MKESWESWSVSKSNHIIICHLLSTSLQYAKSSMPAIRTGNEVTTASIGASTFPIPRNSLRNAIRIYCDSSSTGSTHSDAGRQYRLLRGFLSRRQWSRPQKVSSLLAQRSRARLP
ncbi:hypothetical protein K443DRAFT_387933 [Laccaria amethystina LaAM-08-1]|uniref:Uncharacterized protein n=1 Tax=Laccaria amethystina LaAM-08-1 TaxID=1095629 RepID=A0A0C9XWU3_9AGAR|nr:hypothetical protein K443DRAFT_387933 [Laccaria amethystina LaAM-08-1]